MVDAKGKVIPAKTMESTKDQARASEEAKLPWRQENAKNMEKLAKIKGGYAMKLAEMRKSGGLSEQDTATMVDAALRGELTLPEGGHAGNHDCFLKNARCRLSASLDIT
jgi:hypothetical protein